MKKSQLSQIISIKIPLTPEYSNKHVSISRTEADLRIHLEKGEHVVKSDVVNVGVLNYFEDPVLRAYISIWYTCDPENKILTFCSNDLVSELSPRLTTFPRGTRQFSHQHTYTGDKSGSFVNPNWNHNTPLTPGLELALQQTICEANEVIIKKCRELGFLVIEKTPLPDLSPEEYERLCPVYYRGKFLEFYDPDKVYTNEHSIRHFGSVYGGRTAFPLGSVFSNVVGSRDDPQRDHLSWIALWKKYCNGGNDPVACTSLNCCNGAMVPNFCTNGGRNALMGGHIIRGVVQGPVAPGANNFVFILPICANHNQNRQVSIFMTVVNNPINAVVLNNYFR